MSLPKLMGEKVKRKSPSKWTIPFLLTVLVGLACTGRNDNSPVVARVGHRTLTVKELRAMLPDTGHSPLELQVVRPLIYRWIDREVLYQAAEEARIGEREDIVRQLQQLRRDLLIEYFLADKIATLPEITEAEVKAYYDQNRDYFVRDYPEYRYFYLICKDRKTAIRLKRELREGKDFATLVSENYPQNVLNSEWDSGYVPLERVLPALQRIVPSLQPGTLYGPVMTQGKAVLIRLVERHKANTLKSLEQVRAEIEQRLREEKYREAYQQLLNSLKNKKRIEIHFEALTEK